MSAASVSVKVITWDGTSSVEKAAALKTELMDAFDHASQVVVSLSMLESIDLAAVQLLRAAALEAALRNKSFHLTGTLKPELARAFLVSGFVRKQTDNARELEHELFGGGPRRERSGGQ